MTLPQALVALACASLASPSRAAAPQGEPWLSLEPSQSIQNLWVRQTDGKVVVDIIGVEDGRKQARKELPLHNTPRPTALGQAVSASFPKEASNRPIVDLGFLVDPPGGLSHVMLSDDRRTAVIAILPDVGEVEGNVWVYRLGEDGAPPVGKLMGFHHLVQAATTPTADRVFVQTEDQLLVWETDAFLAGGSPHELQVAGADHWVLVEVNHNPTSKSAYFMLLKKLSVELYRIDHDPAGGPSADSSRLAIAIVPTSNYAIQVDFDVDSKLLAVAEQGRLRVSRVEGPGQLEPLIDYRPQADEPIEIRSCALSKPGPDATSSPTIALGLRKDLERPTLDQTGSCQVSTIILRARPGKMRLPDNILATDWARVQQWNEVSPSVIFCNQGQDLLTWTPQTLWKLSVPR